MEKKSIKSLNYQMLEDEFLALGLKKYRAKQVYDWLYRKNVVSFYDMTNLPQDLMKQLDDIYYIDDLELVERLVSKKDGTKKYLFKVPGGQIIETALMKYNHGYSICVSSQKGCKMGCKFCASTKAAFEGNLTTGQIVDQILKVERLENIRISNVVFMGIGEPFDNFDNVITAIDIINDQMGINIGARHISVSTSGIVPKILEFAKLKPNCTLSVSLHYTTDEKRSFMMPVNRMYSISKLLDACYTYVQETNRRVSFEYALIKGVNDSKEDALLLANLVKNIKCHINLIPINPIEEEKFEQSTDESLLAFRDTLIKQGLVATIRRKLGEDIQAACGQLRKSKMDE